MSLNKWTDMTVEETSPILLSENGYHYRDGALLSELFYNMGKTIGAIHRLSKQYRPTHQRQQYFDKYNMEYVDKVIPDAYAELNPEDVEDYVKCLVEAIPFAGIGVDL